MSAGFALPRDAGRRPALRGGATTAADQPRRVAFSQQLAGGSGRCCYPSLSRNALPTTVSEESAMAAAAASGGNNRPVAG